MKTSPTEILENISYWSMNDPNGKVRKLYGQMTGELSLWIQAYANLYSNKGSMTTGVTKETVDGMSIEKLKKIMEILKYQRYYPKPVKRIYKPKKSGNKKRPLGLPTFTAKLVQEVMRMQLSAVYEPIFSECSHGFRPNRSCHTALKYIKHLFTGTKWFVEGDIKGCFDNINHQILVELIREKVDDERYIELIQRFLDAGYMEEWTYHNTFSGTPQGGVLSPLLANIYLHELDKYMMKLVEEFYTERKKNKEYDRLHGRLIYRRKKMVKARAEERKRLKAEIKELNQELETVLRYKPQMKKLNYCRYADDFIIGVLGSKQDAQNIKQKIAEFLKDKLDLDLSEEKTLVTYHGDKAQFLSYEIGTIPPRSQNKPGRGNIKLYMPKDRIREFTNQFRKGKKRIHLPELTNYEDKEILLWYNQRLRGWYNYWRMAENVSKGMHKIYWFAKGSFLKTMARKYKSSLNKMNKKYYDKIKKQIVVKVKTDKKTKEYRMINSFRRNLEVITDDSINDMLNIYYFPDGVEIKRRIQTDECELCGRKTKDIIAHHVKRMADVRGREEHWKVVMTSKNRKSLMVCKTCHDRIHRRDKTNK